MKIPVSPDPTQVRKHKAHGSNPGSGFERKPFPAPFSLRLTFEERATLEAAAGDVPLGSYIRLRLLGENVTQQRRQHRTPKHDQEALGRVLGALGQSKLANNLNQLARAANSGSLPVTPDTERAIRQACYDVQKMRVELLKALGVTPESGP